MNVDRENAAAIERAVLTVLSQLPYPLVVHGTVTAVVAATGTPASGASLSFAQPTPDGSTPIPIDGVRYPDWYTPTIGDTVIAVYVGSDLFVLTALAA